MDLPIVAIIPSAGKAARMGFDKILAPLCGKNVLERTLEAFCGLPIAKTVIPVTPGRENEFKSLLKDRAEVIAGGNCRARSVFNAVETLKGYEDAIVVIHDCDRPFVSREVILNTIEKAKETGAAIAAQPCSSTVKVVSNDMITDTPDRSSLFLASTPQTFKLSVLRKAYGSLDKNEDWGKLTDEALILEKAGIPVAICHDSDGNFKLTTKKDWDFANYLLSKNA